MKIIAGADIGNSTTEVCLGAVMDSGFRFLSEAMVARTGMKGTPANAKGVRVALEQAAAAAGIQVQDIEVIRINEAAPVMGDTAMETITETVITQSAMIGHNPDTPAGAGLAVGITTGLETLPGKAKEEAYLVLIPQSLSYTEAAERINEAAASGYTIAGGIVQRDEGVLIYNRLKEKIPFVDEVKAIERIPEGKIGAVEVAPDGQTIQTLSNPYGMASIFHLNADETKSVVPIAKSLMGNRSAVVIRTGGGVRAKTIEAGALTVEGERGTIRIPVDAGAEAIMSRISEVAPLISVTGERGTHVGAMIDGMIRSMRDVSEDISQHRITVKDILAVDTTIPVSVEGALAGEVSMENAVGIAAMVKTDALPMRKVAEALSGETGIYVEVAGVEAVMASLGALTTPGAGLPLVILDMGGGSTDAALLSPEGVVKSIHLAGAGQLATLLIDSELGLENRALAERIKTHPLAKVESMFHIRTEDGLVRFFEEPLPPKLYGKVIILDEDGYLPVESKAGMEKIIAVRRDIKKKIFVTNAVRALREITENLREIKSIVLVGGCALDFEIPAMILQELSRYGITAGRGNIRGTCGPRNAVATGLVMSYADGGRRHE